MTNEASGVDRPLWQQITWDQLKLEELTTIQRQARAAIDAKRKHAGMLRQTTGGAGSSAGCHSRSTRARRATGPSSPRSRPRSYKPR